MLFCIVVVMEILVKEFKGEILFAISYATTYKTSLPSTKLTIKYLAHEMNTCFRKVEMFQ